MLFKKYDRNSVEWKRIVAWIAATSVMPFGAYPFVQDSMPNLKFDIPTAVIFGLSWAICSIIVYFFIKKYSLIELSQVEICTSSMLAF